MTKVLKVAQLDNIRIVLKEIKVGGANYEWPNFLKVTLYS